MGFLVGDEPMQVACVFPFNEAEVAALEGLQSYADGEAVVVIGRIGSGVQGQVDMEEGASYDVVIGVKAYLCQKVSTATPTAKA